MFVLFGISIAIALMFMISPILLKFNFFSYLVGMFLNGLLCREYKAAFIGAIGGMIGTFLAVSGALFVAQMTSRDERKKELQRNALIVYYDIKLFFEENNKFVLGLNHFIICPGGKLKLKEKVTIHICSEWISVVASLNKVLSTEEIEKLYLFYGNLEEMKKFSDKEELLNSNLPDIKKIVNNLGEVKNGEYQSKSDISTIMDKLQKIYQK